MDGAREIRQELRRLTARFFVAVSLDLFTGVCKRAAGLDRSDTKPGTETMKNGHVALSWASEFNLLAHLCFLLVISQITTAPVVVVERMRKLRLECDVQLVMGLICVIISFSFLAYLRWFVVVWVLSRYQNISLLNFSVELRWLQSLFLLFFLLFPVNLGLNMVCFFDLNLVCDKKMIFWIPFDIEVQDWSVHNINARYSLTKSLWKWYVCCNFRRCLIKH